MTKHLVVILMSCCRHYYYYICAVLKVFKHECAPFSQTKCNVNSTESCTFTGDKMTWNIHLHFSVIEQHAIHFLNGSLGCLLSLKMHKAVAFRTILVTNHLRERRHMLPLGHTRHVQYTKLELLVHVSVYQY